MIGRRRSRRQDGKLAVDLHGIGIDDGAAQALGKHERRRGLAARGRPGNEDGLGPARFGAAVVTPAL